MTFIRKRLRFNLLRTILESLRGTRDLKSIILFNLDGSSLDLNIVDHSGQRDGAQEVRDNFSLTLGQVNFDGKLLDDLNRLAVLVVKETENQILGIAKTANATGEYFFYISFYISPISLRLNPDYSIINNLFINNLYITFNPPICRKGGSRDSYDDAGHVGDRREDHRLWLSHYLLQHRCPRSYSSFLADISSGWLAGITSWSWSSRLPSQSCLVTLSAPRSPSSSPPESWTTLGLTDIRRPTIPTPFKADTASLLTFIQHRLKPEQASLLPRVLVQIILPLLCRHQ